MTDLDSAKASREALNYRAAADIWPTAASEMLSPPKGVRLPWWPGFTDLVGGLRPHELTLLCAPTGAGKTSLLANISAQLVKSKVPHLVAPVETGDSDFLIRVLSALDEKDYNTGEPISVERLEWLQAKHQELIQSKHLFISTHDNRVEIKDMIGLLMGMHSLNGVKVALLDNLNFFLKVVSSDKEKMEMDSAIHEFVILAKNLPMHVILICHPRKTDKGRVESEFDIKGSSTAVQEASNVLLFNRPTEDDLNSGRKLPTDRELIFKKIRKRGVNVNKPIWLHYENARFLEVR